MRRWRRKQSSTLGEQQGRDILIVLVSLEYGGVEMASIALANALNQRGRQPVIMCGTAREELRGRLDPAIDFKCLSVGSAIRLLMPLRRYLSQNPNVSIISTQAHVNIVSILAKLLAPRHRGRLIVQEVAQLATPADPGTEWRHALIRHLRRYLYPMADAVVAVSDDIARSLTRELDHRAKVITIGPPIPITDIRQAAAEPPDSRDLPVGDGPLIVGLGRMVSSKRFDIFLDVIAHVRRSLPVRAVLIGDGPMRDELDRRRIELELRESVHLVGPVQNALAFIKIADVMLIPSSIEGFGLAAMEALALGCPVVTANYGSLAVEIWQELYGVRPPEAEDRLGIARALTRVLDSPPPSARMMQIAAKYDARIIAEAYDRLMTNM